MASAIPILVAIIDMSMVMMHMHNASVEATKSGLLQRKKSRVAASDGDIGGASSSYSRQECEEETLTNLHKKQILDLVVWHIDVLDAKWYVKPRSTCWFEEYLFNIYTPDMFYDILRMRRRTFDMIVRDIRPFIQGQHTHTGENPSGWRKK